MKMNILKYVKAVGLSVAVATLSLVSCEDMIYDYEGDCSVTYRVKFRYDKNLKWADAFANEVKSVRLYAFDPDGTLVKEFTESGSQLANPDYTMNIDLPAGRYHLVAWCGIDNPEASQRHFTVPETTVGSTSLESLTCRLNREANETYPAYSDNRLEFMFHGDLDVELPEDNDGGDYLYVMSLTKDTNHIRVILQHLSGEDLDVKQFGFSIEDDNGYYAHNNDLLPDETITYLAYDRKTGQAGIGKELLPSRAIIQVNGAIADLSVGRMMADHSQKMILTVTNADNEVVARVPIIDYALLAKEYYEEAYGHKMENQEFLDREDEYTLTFFLDENQQWGGASIWIHSWRIVLQDVGVE